MGTFKEKLKHKYCIRKYKQKHLDEKIKFIKKSLIESIENGFNGWQCALHPDDDYLLSDIIAYFAKEDITFVVTKGENYHVLKYNFDNLEY